ncbi:hypothetical protein [Niveispirillum fermenti]|uniref:tetratricopeptide repeat protein n=1 Tax=Niveispirillum fermenti TaxID=1233113 RepID=UPI003A840FD1
MWKVANSEFPLIVKALQERWKQVAAFATLLGLIADALTLLAPIALWLMITAMAAAILAAVIAGCRPPRAAGCRAVLAHAIIIAPMSGGLHFAHISSGEQERGFFDAMTGQLGDLKEAAARIEQSQQHTLKGQQHILDILQSQHSDTSPIFRQGQESAITAAVTGAAAGNQRMAAALDHLNRGDITAARALFEKEAEAQKADAETRNHQAAAAFRHLGAITGPADPMRALTAYKQAVALDPDNVQGLVYAGDFAFDSGDLAYAHEKFRRAVDLTPAADLSYDRYWALIRLGDIAALEKDNARARQHFDAASAIAFQRGEQSPDDLEWQRELSVIHNRIGAIQLAGRDYEGALTSYRQGLSLARKLVDQSANTHWQRDLSISHERVGDTLRALRKLDAALESYGSSLIIADNLARSRPDHLQWQHDLSVIHNKIGATLLAKGNLDGALAAYEQGVTIRKGLVDKQPTHLQWQRDLSINNAYLGSVLARKGDRVRARKAFEEARDIMIMLLARFPANQKWQQAERLYDRQVRALEK